MTTTHSYSITTGTLQTALKARREQVKAAKEALAKIDDPYTRRRTAKEQKAARLPGFARLQFVNGSTREGAVSLRQLAAWAGTHGKNAVIAVAFTDAGVRFARGQSAVTFYLREYVPTGDRYADIAPAATLGDPIRLVAPVDGGEFVAQ